MVKYLGVLEDACWFRHFTRTERKEEKEGGEEEKGVHECGDGSVRQLASTLKLSFVIHNIHLSYS